MEAGIAGGGLTCQSTGYGVERAPHAIKGLVVRQAFLDQDLNVAAKLAPEGLVGQ